MYVAVSDGEMGILFFSLSRPLLFLYLEGSFLIRLEHVAWAAVLSSNVAS